LRGEFHEREALAEPVEHVNVPTREKQALCFRAAPGDHESEKKEKGKKSNELGNSEEKRGSAPHLLSACKG